MLDNEAAKFAFIRGFSDNTLVDLFVKKFATIEADSQRVLWFCRVPSYNNIADPPSRGDITGLADAKNRNDDAAKLLENLLGELGEDATDFLAHCRKD